MKRLPRTAAMDAIYANPDNDPRGPWLSGTLISPHYRASGDFEVVTPGGTVQRAPTGTSWRVPRETFHALVADNRIWFGVRGTAAPQKKVFLSEVADRVVDTLWEVEEVGGNRQSKAEIKAIFPDIPPFATPKPERLMQRIIHVATDPGDLVLDCFVGSGTTAAVAHKMGRRWIASELRADTVETFARPRLERVVSGTEPGGITAEVSWEGGGGFTVAEVAPSMFEDAGGVIVLAEWATGGALAEAVAAQVGHALEADPPFVGRRGRSRLAVIDGVLSEDVARFLVGRLDDRQTVLIVAQAIEEGVSDLVRTLRPGSRVRKVPRDLARTSRVVGPIVTLGTTEPTGQVRMPV